jgi:MoaA/NifB/PqqE/SkfB family radical SAM enzyme
MNATNPYCTAPWNGLTIREDGSVKTCCPGKIVIGNVKDTPITQILNNDVHTKIKNDLLNNQPNSNCEFCINQEKDNGNSLRSYYNKNYPTLSDKLKILDIRWNNFCNLTCIYCNPAVSSAWQDRLDTNVIKIIKNSYDSDLEEWVLTNADNLIELMLVGGEPLLMKQNYALLSKLPNSTRVSIITNLSYNLKNNPATTVLFNRPLDNTIWNVSVENYGKQFEYVRHGADWEQFKNNLILLVENNPNNVGLLMVYGIFSALSLLDTIKYYYSIGIKKIELQPIANNPALEIHNFPKPIIQLAYDQLIAVVQWQKDTYTDDYNLYKITSIDNLIERLYISQNSNNNRQIITRTQFLTNISQYDKWHTDKFSTLWPNEYSLILESLK